MSRDEGSFRDPSGFVFEFGGKIYRQVAESYKADYDCLVASGLLAELWKKRWLVEHREVEHPCASQQGDECYKVLEVERVPFISYPYEWSFSQVRKAALLTLRIQQLALEHGLSLKDASAFNVQFIGSRPVFIDTLSFERHVEGAPWSGYRQFCTHFLGPLTLMSAVDPRIGQFWRSFIDGVPLDLTVKLLPWHRRIAPSNFLHLVMHSRYAKRYASDANRQKAATISTPKLKLLVEHLLGAIRKLKSKRTKTTWDAYYGNTNYTTDAMSAKEQLVTTLLGDCQGLTVWDLGANDGKFSKLAADAGAFCVAMDVDANCVERHFLKLSAERDERVLPLFCDFSNPASALGWHHRERQSLTARGPADVSLALALVHDLAIGMNVPLPLIASFMGDCSKRLIVEFVPKEDSKVADMLSTREDIFPDYTKEGFEQAFTRVFNIISTHPIAGTSRCLYEMEKRAD